MKPSLDPPVEAGQGIYTKPVLACYDYVVIGFSNRYVWKCPSNYILAWYNQHVSANHLDVGVGTGYFLDYCRFPSDHPRLGLMDLNATCLDVTAHRVARYRPEIYQANVLVPLPCSIARFDSIGLSYLLHCLPGTIHTKGVVFQHLKKILNPEGVMFGTTLLHGGVKRSWLARRLMAMYNRKGIFTNTADDLDGLHEVLAQHFAESRIEVIGCVALFAGWSRTP